MAENKPATGSASDAAQAEKDQPEPDKEESSDMWVAIDSPHGALAARA